MKKKPNLLFILTDDQGAWALNCAGNTDISTPNLDHLAEQGMRFDNFFCASPVCSPARASILTGCIPSQHGVHDWIRSGSLDKEKLGEHKDHPYFASEDIPISYLDGYVTYSDLLAEKGYTCALSGKWHLGNSMQPQHGFSRWYTIGRGGCMYNQADVIEDGKLHFENRYITDLITEHALQYLEELSKTDNPFYISVHYTAPHDPWDADQHPKEFIEMYRDCSFTATPEEPPHPNQIPSAPCGVGEERKRLLRGYYAAISAMDAGVGKILDKLKDLGLEENTLVIFTADNGMNMGHHGIWGKGNGTFPMNLYDTSVKVPFIARWPGKILPGVVTESMCSHYDIIQTLNELLDLKATLPENLPGKSFATVLLTGENKDNHIVIFDEYGNSRMIRNREWKYMHRYPYGPHELYHLITDPGEKENLIEQLDNPVYREIRENLLSELQKWYLTYADPAVDGSREAVTGFGQLRRPGAYSEGKPVYADIPKNGK
ncbi:MAG: sulfatase-like hydrolase/transferase [Candidatus Treponema excrementipullorum]|nr:sulfatase-like hydrolase/transferase [Candidatus Treponema excrementipullorum]